MSKNDPTNAERQARYRKKNRAAYVRLIAVVAALKPLQIFLDEEVSGLDADHPLRLEVRQLQRQVRKAKTLLRTHGVEI